MASDTKERTAKERVLWAVGLAAVIFYALIPVAWIVSLSLKPSSQLTDGKFFPRSTTLENYRAIFEDSQFPSALRNSIGIALISTVLAVTLAMFAAYAIVRLDFPGRKLVLADYRPAICMQPRSFPLLEQLALRQTRSVPRVPATAQGLNASLLLSLLWLIREDQAGEENLPAISLAYQDLKPALEYLETGGSTGLNIAALARLCGLSPGTFSRRMQECFNESPKHYLLRTRIDRAKSMLLESAYTIEAIAGALDYSEPAHFSRQFKKYTGVTPSAFRTSHQ